MLSKKSKAFMRDKKGFLIAEMLIGLIIAEIIASTLTYVTVYFVNFYNINKKQIAVVEEIIRTVKLLEYDSLNMYEAETDGTTLTIVNDKGTVNYVIESNKILRNNGVLIDSLNNAVINMTDVTNGVVLSIDGTVNNYGFKIPSYFFYKSNATTIETEQPTDSQPSDSGDTGGVNSDKGKN